MRVVVCNRLTEYLGIEIVSALLKQAGHTVELVFEPDLLSATFVRKLRLDSASRAARRVVEFRPDVVLFPSEINSFEWCARVGARAKAALPSCVMVHGGFQPDSVLVGQEGQGLLMDLGLGTVIRQATRGLPSRVDLIQWCGMTKCR